MKTEGKGGDFSGPTIKKIIHSEEIFLYLAVHLGEKFDPIIQLLRGIVVVHNLCRSRELNNDFRIILGEFTICMEECNQKFRLSKILKSKIISDHLQEYFKMTGKSLLCQSDEHMEAKYIYF